MTLLSHFISAPWGVGKVCRCGSWLLGLEASPQGSQPPDRDPVARSPPLASAQASVAQGGAAGWGGRPQASVTRWGAGEARRPHLALGRSRPGVAWAPGASGEETRAASTNTNTQARPSSSEPSLPSEPQLRSGSRAQPSRRPRLRPAGALRPRQPSVSPRSSPGAPRVLRGDASRMPRR